MAEQKPWFVHAFELLYEGWNFAQFLGAVGLGAVASYVHLVGNTPLAPWFLVLASTLAGWGSVRLVRQAWRRIHVIFNRPHTIIEIEDGSSKASMEIGHFGAPLEYSAVGRIVRALDDTVAPKPTRNRFQCELQLAEGRPNSQRVMLRDGEWAHIVLADEIKEPRLHIRRGTFGRNIVVPDSGVELEIEITTYPGRRTTKRMLHVTRAGDVINAVAVGD